MVRKVFALWHLADCKDGSYLDLSMSHSGSVNKHSLTSDCHTGTFNGWSICLHSLLTATLAPSMDWASVCILSWLPQAEPVASSARSLWTATVHGTHKLLLQQMEHLSAKWNRHKQNSWISSRPGIEMRFVCFVCGQWKLPTIQKYSVLQVVSGKDQAAQRQQQAVDELLLLQPSNFLGSLVPRPPFNTASGLGTRLFPGKNGSICEHVHLYWLAPLTSFR